MEKLWTCTRDLLEEGNVEARHSALWLLRCVAEGQADHLQLMRTIMFRYLRETHTTRPPDDDPLRFKLLHTLTNTGKNINCFEEEVSLYSHTCIYTNVHLFLRVILLEMKAVAEPIVFFTTRLLK